MSRVIPIFSVRELGLDYQVPIADPRNSVVPDTQRPHVTITLPVNNTTVSGTINIVATATDNVAIASVQFNIDGENFGAPIPGPGPYIIPWNTTGVSDGTHQLLAIATDTSGNPALSAFVDVNILNLPNYVSNLNNLIWAMPNTGFAMDGTGICTDPADVTANLTGDPAKTYNVTLRFRGIVEIKEYTGGSQSLYFYTGGAGANPGSIGLNPLRNQYELNVSNPSAHYFLNAYQSTASGVFVIDYTATIPIKGGATVTFKTRSEDGFQFANSGNLIVTVGGGDPPILVGQPYNGQFIQCNVVSIVEA